MSQVIDYYPILKKYGFPATFYVVAAHIGLPGKLSAQHLHALAAEGNEIGSHGWTHRSLPRLSSIDLRSELEKSWKALEPFGARTFSYPYGHHDSRVVAEVANYYDSGRTYDVVVAPNQRSSIDRFALQSFPVEGRFRSRMSYGTSDYLLQRKDIVDEDAFFILTLHGRSSLKFAARTFVNRGLPREQVRAYLNTIRTGLSGGRGPLLFDFESFCAHIARGAFVVTTVSNALERLR